MLRRIFRNRRFLWLAGQSGQEKQVPYTEIPTRLAGATLLTKTIQASSPRALLQDLDTGIRTAKS